MALPIFKSIGHFLFIIIIVLVTIPAFYYGNEGIEISLYFLPAAVFIGWLIGILIRGITQKDSGNDGFMVLSSWT
ncbi:MAG: hypothetical protein ACI9XO_002389 [Paraglaciecola sp.]